MQHGNCNVFGAFLAEMGKMRQVSEFMEIGAEQNWRKKKGLRDCRKSLIINRVVGVGVEPTNSVAERIYSPRPLASWIPHRLKDFIKAHYLQIHRRQSSIFFTFLSNSPSTPIQGLKNSRFRAGTILPFLLARKTFA